jgi:hypothetical protein
VALLHLEAFAVSTPPAPETVRKGRRTLLLIALVSIAPIIASYTAYYFFPRDSKVNYGELLPTQPAPDVAGTRVDGKPFRLSDLRGRWVLAVAADGACDAGCDKALYAIRQARTMQGREMERVERLWLVTDGVPPRSAVVTEQPDLLVVRGNAAGLSPFGAGPDRIYLVDPLGNLVLAYPRDPDIKGLAKDLTRLLKASRIG